MATQSTIEHLVKPGTVQHKSQRMINLGGLVSLDPVRHLTVGPIILTGSSPISFTHMLHSRYDSQEDLNTYSQHPSHMGLVRESVPPICEGIMAIDWVADQTPNPIVLSQGSAVRVTFLKLKENVGEDVKNEILGATKGIKESSGRIK